MVSKRILNSCIIEYFRVQNHEFMTASNGQGFLMCGYSVIRQPEPMMSKVNAVDIIFYTLVLFVQPEL